MSPRPETPLSDADVDRMLHAFQESRTLLTAIELKLFAAVGDGATAAEITSRLGTENRATELLLNALVSLGLLAKHNGVFSNLPVSAKLTDPGLIHQVNRWHSWSRLTDRVRGGAPAHFADMEPSQFAALLAHLDRRARDRAPKLLQVVGTEGVRRMLDVGGGSGAYSIAFANAAPELRADVFELPAVAPLTRDYIRRAGCDDRVRVITGDLTTDDLGSGYDLVLLFSVAHLLGAAQNRQLFARCHAALALGGRLVIHDHVVAADRTRPRESAMFALQMLVATAEGQTHTEGDYREWLAGAGFSEVDVKPLPNAHTAFIIAVRRSPATAGATD